MFFTRLIPLVVATASCVAVETAVRRPLINAPDGHSGARPPKDVNDLPLPASTIAQLDRNDTFFENIVVRPNGDLLATLYEPLGAIYTVQKPWAESRRFTELYNFNPGLDPNGPLGVEYTAVLGITERGGKQGKDNYLICGGRFKRGNNPPTDVVKGSQAIWEMSFPNHHPYRQRADVAYDDHHTPASSQPAVQVRHIANLTEGGLLNGLTASPDSCAAIIADNNNGNILRLDLTTGQSSVLLDVPETQHRPVNSTGFAVNGVRFSKDGKYLYWSNLDLISLYRIAVDRSGIPLKSAKLERVADLSALAISVDDFALDKNGDVWVTTHASNTIIRITNRDGQGQVVAGSPTELTLAGSTALAFGRGRFDRHMVYVTTNGGTVAPVNGTVIEPAKIVAVDARKLLA